MEDPHGWDALTASLAVCDLDRDLPAAWAFLVLQGLLRDGAGDRDRFFGIARQEIERGPITGPTVAWRVAAGLRSTGLAVGPHERPDPLAAAASARYAIVLSWRE
jgi:hypothetical protein